MSGSPSVEGINLLIGGGVGAGLLKMFDTWMAKRRSPEQAAAALIELAMKASGSSVESLLSRLKDTEDRLDALAEAHEECEGRCTALQGQVRQQEQRIDSLLRQLRDPGSMRPGGSLSGAIIEVTKDDVLITRPRRKQRALPSDSGK